MSLLGQNTPVPEQYAPEILAPIPRAEAREQLGIGGELPFHGEDIWHAWELSWLDAGQPRCAVGRFAFPADSPNLVESKSFKLYLNSLNDEVFESRAALVQTLEKDLSGVAGAEVEVTLLSPDATELMPAPLPGECIDELEAVVPSGEPAPRLLDVQLAPRAEQQIYSHALRSLCPVTAQPDWATVVLHCQGARVDPFSFLQYLYAFRHHQEFHEQCVERMFRDLTRAGLVEFSVQALFTRRGGLDISPWRSASAGRAPLLRSLRQ